MNFRFCECSVLICLLVIVQLRINVESKAQYVQPVLMGLQVAIPYDLANIWNRPVSFAPYLSTFLGLSLLYILFFGVITSPFGYMFGVPSQKYVIGMTNTTQTFFDFMINVAEQMNTDNSASASSRSFGKPLIRKLLQYEWSYPDFSESVFKFIPISDDNEPCQQLILCSAHTALSSLQDSTKAAYRIFSKTLTNIPESYRKSIKAGLSGYKCEDVFNDCPSDVHSLVLTMLLKAIPDWLRRSLTFPQFS